MSTSTLITMIENNIAQGKEIFPLSSPALDELLDDVLNLITSQNEYALDEFLNLDYGIFDESI